MQKSKRVLRWVVNIALILLFISSGYLSVYNLRQNNLKMLELREAVFTADRDDGDTATALSKLQLFVVTHMNTTLPKLGEEKAIQLKYTYERRIDAEEARVSAARTALSSEATDYCQRTFAGASFAVRSQCVEDYYTAHPVSSLEIPKELYAYDFVTPLWVPDRAGLLILAAAFLGLVLLLRLISWLVVRHSSRSIQ
ncbi:MAG: hypothetical protein AAB624_03680 [Patescibacteria group bacterium]